MSLVGRTCLIAAIAILVDTGTATAQGPSQPLVYEGFTEPQIDILVSGMDMGRLSTMDVKVGQRVRKGEQIAKLDDDLQRAALEIANMQATATGELDVARSELRMYRSRVESYRRLGESGMARPDELTNAVTDFEIAEGRFSTAADQLALRQAERKRQRLQLQRRMILSPIDGLVAEVLKRAGEHVSPADPGVVRIINADAIEGVFNVPVEEIAQFWVEAPVRVYLRSLRKTVSGKVDVISPMIDGQSGTIEVRVRIPNPKGLYRAGDRCTLRLAPGASPPRSESATSPWQPTKR
ncbi:MAG: efflux RND transporter periplasmic adaptor subunit [Planctomycetota bacterium]